MIKTNNNNNNQNIKNIIQSTLSHYSLEMQLQKLIFWYHKKSSVRNGRFINVRRIFFNYISFTAFYVKMKKAYQAMLRRNPS